MCKFSTFRIFFFPFSSLGGILPPYLNNVKPCVLCRYIKLSAVLLYYQIVLHEMEPLEQGLVGSEGKGAPQKVVSEGEEHPFDTQALLHWTAFALLQ